jgi:2-polyprenyl-3-methyl-5-hydroxy-6-metoxy-1,4-benzoquinol methylase
MTHKPYANNPVVPRFHPDDLTIREETRRHHVKRYELATKQLRKAGQLAIDLCCGTGYGTAMLADAGATAIGVDLSEEAISYARQTNPGVVFEVARVQDFLRESKRKPNLVTFFEAIEHIPRADGRDVLDAVQGSLASDGHFLMSTPRDIRADVNPDHITQWRYDELRNELMERFDGVNLFGQDWSTGEFIHDEPADASFYVSICSQPKQ